MKRFVFMSLVAVIIVMATTSVALARPLLMFHLNLVDTTADTLLSHTVLAHGYLDSSPVPLAAGLYEFHVGIYSELEGGELLWTSTQPIEVESGGLLRATFYNIPWSVFSKKENGTIVMKKRFLQLDLPALDKSYPRFVIDSPENALAASRIFQYRLFSTWGQQPPTHLPDSISEGFREFIKNKQVDEVINHLVGELVRQKIQMQQMQDMIDELKKRAEKL